MEYGLDSLLSCHCYSKPKSHVMAALTWFQGGVLQPSPVNTLLPPCGHCNGTSQPGPCIHTGSTVRCSFPQPQVPWLEFSCGSRVCGWWHSAGHPGDTVPMSHCCLHPCHLCPLSPLVGLKKGCQDRGVCSLPRNKPFTLVGHHHNNHILIQTGKEQKQL